MNQYVTGTVIKELREKNHMTQAELAEKLFSREKSRKALASLLKWGVSLGF